jgi:myo-inositol-1(or 4)-monophosphatase
METKKKNYLDIAKYMLKLEQNAYKKCSRQRIDVRDKGPHDLVTSLDTALEKFCLAELKKAFPDVKVVSEEYNSKVKAEGTYFTIDPIDGTVNFANRMYDMWGMQMAYVENNVTVAAAIMLPSISDYYAAKGFGAFKNGRRFKASQNDPTHSLVVMESKDLDRYCLLWKELAKKILKFRHFGASSIHSTLTAEGKVGGNIQYCGNAWDVLPGFLLMDEAGCLMKKVGNFAVYANSQETLELLCKAVEKTEKTKTSNKTKAKKTSNQTAKNTKKGR